MDRFGDLFSFFDNNYWHQKALKLKLEPLKILKQIFQQIKWGTVIDENEAKVLNLDLKRGYRRQFYNWGNAFMFKKLNTQSSKIN